MSHLPEGLPELPPMIRASMETWQEDALKEYGLACYRAGLERAAQLCEPQVIAIPDRGDCPKGYAGFWISGGSIERLPTAAEIAAAIRAEKDKS